MARIAEAVYECTSDCDQLPNEATILAGLKQDDDGFRSVMGVDKNSAQAALVEHDDYLCMAFRGTNELADWLDNLNAFSTPQLFGEFHRGFWLCCEDVWAPMFARCLELQGEKKRPVFRRVSLVEPWQRLCRAFADGQTLHQCLYLWSAAGDDARDCSDI